MTLSGRPGPDEPAVSVITSDDMHRYLMKQPAITRVNRAGQRSDTPCRRSVSYRAGRALAIIGPASRAVACPHPAQGWPASPAPRVATGSYRRLS